ncbi:hypothetical protein AB8807_03815 [Xanthomonas campestris pv. olitorii]|uniref:hypothetical protein n=1 Tax=Xanthomonas TaxID=338 RepID=UPI00080E8194|nr:hypothetical protein [Xanthomonas euvesicatoria]WVK04775.1 hypothetical protein KWH09_03800 [Xanthomonas campestris pv. olitorii]MBV6687729.1 hypothetical protein [Xanthomonas euvesicatoria pv. physalidis]MBV6786857.1 hypothetical protein [Xanthomonas campestris pv. uppalii]MBV6792888.1 hypothetical protein [Xanthomonas campestris pv. daturae]MBV6796869.1 hypothetical protein [Xanthomonas campestris pv. obscurae]
MQVIARRLGAASKYDRLACVRADGSHCEVDLPRQGILPHDLIHLWVESRLGLSDGFIGLVAKGADIDYAGKELHRHVDPQRQMQAGQAESVVEALQSQLWSGQFDDAMFHYGLAQACSMRGVMPPELEGVAPKEDLFVPLTRLGAAWNAMAAGTEWRLAFPWQPGMEGHP